MMRVIPDIGLDVVRIVIRHLPDPTEVGIKLHLPDNEEKVAQEIESWLPIGKVTPDIKYTFSK